MICDIRKNSTITFKSFQRQIMHGTRVPCKPTSTFDPDKPVEASYEYRGKIYHRVCKALYDHQNSIVVRIERPIAPELGNKIAVSKRTVKQDGHWCFPKNHNRPRDLSHTLYWRDQKKQGWQKQ